MDPLVSVIVPIYKVEKFIEHNARQLFQQDLEGVEYIFVDDCSPDQSIQILERVLEEYTDKQKSTRIIRHAINMGLPTARNSGLALARGEFIFHCDGDDWLEKNMLSKLFYKAKEDGSDVVWCDWFLSFKDNERYMSQAPLLQGTLTGRQCVELILGGRVRYNVWNKLVKRELYEKQLIRFPDGHGMGEDMTMIKVLAFSTKVSYLPLALYHYTQLNTEAFTQKTDSKHLIQLRHNADQIIAFLKDFYGVSIEENIQFFKLNIKLPFLISRDILSYRRWLEWYPEANTYIARNPMFNRRIQIIQYAALKRQYWILRLYYFLFIRVVYGIIYK